MPGTSPFKRRFIGRFYVRSDEDPQVLLRSRISHATLAYPHAEIFGVAGIVNDSVYLNTPAEYFLHGLTALWTDLGHVHHYLLFIG